MDVEWQKRLIKFSWANADGVCGYVFKEQAERLQRELDAYLKKIKKPKKKKAIKKKKRKKR